MVFNRPLTRNELLEQCADEWTRIDEMDPSAMETLPPAPLQTALEVFRSSLNGVVAPPYTAPSLGEGLAAQVLNWRG